MNNIATSALTTSHDGIRNVIITECAVCAAFDPSKALDANKKKTNKYNGIWDTGATCSVISKRVIDELNLKPIGIIDVFNTSGHQLTSTYKINMILPSNVGVSFLDVTEGSLVGADVLIGMDVICRGDFAISNSNGKTKFTFQIPATHEIDFVKEYNEKFHTPVKVGKQQERNTLCSCGSGEKYKNCCGKK